MERNHESERATINEAIQLSGMVIHRYSGIAGSVSV